MERYSCPCISTKRVGKILRTLVIVSNILYWFAGCSVLSIAIWIRFVNVGAKNYYSTFYPFDTGVYVVLVASILFLVVSFVGTCAANTKNEMMLSLYIAVLVVVSTAEIISLIIFSSHYEEIEKDFLAWYRDNFVKYSHDQSFYNDVVDHVQSKMKCCGLARPSDYFNIFDNHTIPNSCMIKAKKSESILRPELHATGCLQKLQDLVSWVLRGWPIPFTASMMLVLQATGITSSILFLQHIYTRRNNIKGIDEEDGDVSNLLKSKPQTQNETDVRMKEKPIVHDLPRPRMYRVVKSSEESSYGFTLCYDEKKERYCIADVQTGSNAAFAGVPPQGEIVEINGMLVDGVTEQWVQQKMTNEFNEVRLVVIDEKTDSIYRSQKVSVNLKNIEGVTDVGIEYRPRLCKLTKGVCGFGFHLLYLEDRKGEYIEEVAVGSSAHAAGLNAGDRILEVNGVNIESETSSEVVKQIRLSGDAVGLLVVDPKTDGYYRKKGVTVTASMSSEYFDGRIMKPTMSPKEIRKHERDVNPRYCCLVKSAKQDYGLYVVIDNSRIGQVIRWVDCGGPADKAGLRIGDRIIEVNGFSVEYESHQRLISCISAGKTASHFIVVDEEYDQVYKRNKPRLCHIFKEAATLGFCLCYQENMGGHYVEKVDDGGPAQRAGLEVGDRIIQVNGQNVEVDAHQNVLNRLRNCKTDVILLVIDAKSNNHYKRIVEFKESGLSPTDYTDLHTLEEPLFVPDAKSPDECDASLSFVDSTRGRIDEDISVTSLKENPENRFDRQGYRTCVIQMTNGEKYGFFLAIDRNRNGQVLRSVQKGGAADRAGLRDGDRIISVNGENIGNVSHEEIVKKIRESGKKIILTVVDQMSDVINIKHRPYIFRIMKDDGGYGFYLWHDEYGHYVEDVTIGSPADKCGMRSGDRIIEVNGVNVEEETHEELFYRVKACNNVVTLLAVDLKTFKLYKSQGIPGNMSKRDFAYSGFNSPKSHADAEYRETNKAISVTRDLQIRRRDGGDFGFNLAYSNSFMDDSSSGFHTVYWVEEGGPAYLAGLRDGDKIIAIDGHDVSSEDHDKLVRRLYEVGKLITVITVQYEEASDARDAHTVIIEKMDNSFGFHLWFDENGHYIEDVTIGSPADKAGLKIGDRVLKVNAKNIEDAVHADVVNIARESGPIVKLSVYSVQKQSINETGRPTVHTIKKQHGTFGFAISQDERGFHMDFVAESSSADSSGIKVGDRLLEVNGEQVSDLTLNAVISMIRASGECINLTIMSSSNNGGGMSKAYLQEGTSTRGRLWNELLAKEEIDGSVDPSHESGQDGTDMRDEENVLSHVDGTTKLNYSAGEDNVAFIKEESPAEENNFSQSGHIENDLEGRYLEEKLARAAVQAIQTRRKLVKNVYSQRNFKPETRRRVQNLTYIENKFCGPFEQRKNRNSEKDIGCLTQESTSRNTVREKDRFFRLVSQPDSLTEKWSFERYDSRVMDDNATVRITESVLDNFSEETETDVPQTNDGAEEKQCGINQGS